MLRGCCAPGAWGRGLSPGARRKGECLRPNHLARACAAQGGQAIVEKLTALPFGVCQHQARHAPGGAALRRALCARRLTLRRSRRALTRPRRAR